MANKKLPSNTRFSYKRYYYNFVQPNSLVISDIQTQESTLIPPEKMGNTFLEGIVLDETCVLPSVKTLYLPEMYSIVEFTRHNFPSLEEIQLGDFNFLTVKNLALYQFHELIHCLSPEKTFVVPPETSVLRSGAFKDCPAETILVDTPYLHIKTGAFAGSAWEKKNDLLTTQDTLLYLSRDLEVLRPSPEIAHIPITCFLDHSPQKLFLPSFSLLEVTKDTIPKDFLLHEICLEENPFPLPIEATYYSFETLSFQRDIEGLRWIDGVLFSADASTLLFYPRLRPGTKYQIPEGTKAIGTLAFHRAQFLTEVVFPSSVTSFGGGAFSFMPLLSRVNLPKEVKSLPDASVPEFGVFSYCPSLSQIDLPKSLRRIGDYAFYSSGLRALALPEGVRELGKSCFENAPLREVHLPSTLSQLGEGAIEGAAETWAYEGTAKGLYQALRAHTDPSLSSTVHVKSDSGQKELFFPGMDVMYGFDLFLVWDGNTVDYHYLSDHFDWVPDPSDKAKLALILASQEKEEKGYYHRYLRRISRKLGMQLIEKHEEVLFQLLLQEARLTPATQKALLDFCNEHGYTREAALLLDYQEAGRKNNSSGDFKL